VRASGLAAGIGVLFGLAVWAASPRSAHAYDFSMELRTIGQGYQLRGFAPTGASTLLTRRRLTQYVNLNVYDIEPASWHGDGADRQGRNVVYLDASLRFDTDFGGFMMNRPVGTNEIRELQQNQVDVLYAFLGAKRLGGRVDLQLGRQIHFDVVDFYAFDGLDALVRLSHLFAVEAYGGTEVRGEAPLGSPIYELDGTSVGSRDPATRPGQASQLRPLMGAAAVLGPDGGLPVTARLAYRRIQSATADRLPGEPGWGVNDEKVALTINAAVARRVFLTGGFRYNLLLATFDDGQMALRVRASARQWLTAEATYLAPTWDGDSIWNVFAAGAYGDLRGTYELALWEGLRLYARGFARLFVGTPDQPERGSGWAGGGSAGVVWRRTRGVLRGDGYFDDGFGGRKAGVDVSGRWEILPRVVELEGRLTGYEWQSDQQPATDRGFVLGGQVGARWRLGDGIRLHVLGENNVGTFYTGQYRGLAVLELNASI
jgi:hypothetical protein